MKRPEEFGAEIVEALQAYGWYAGAGYFEADLCRGLKEEALAIYTNSQGDGFYQARVGDRFQNLKDTRVRQDQIHWLDPLQASPWQSIYLQRSWDLMMVLKRAMFLPINGFESHFAMYQSGAFYKKHVDSFQGRNARLLSLIVYLNDDWGESDGGQLRIYREDNPEVEAATIQPEMGRFVIFLSETIHHEVLPSHRPRLSLTGCEIQ
ncbi:2OG-Fe(II) oxygenase [Pseudobacteriovorax antillogorgiicola]|uniref:2OG-Fe(II) oxygenase n=1 Tax=Pseudobacteriovorax antillogorgiicola TaxID=1513793 RepID=UPI001F26744C|nr:2OG-Fe(II) oxygenase [Pseudobacteriovorax antillogorgiicola]